jgi:hypothetical protein
MALVADINDPLIVQVIGYTRFALRDFEELNRLTVGVDHSDRHIYWAILMTLSDWASTPPFVGANFQYIMNHGWIALFVRGVMCELIQSLMFLHMRNYLSYSDGGVPVQTEHPQLLQSSLTMMRSIYEQQKLRALVAANIEDAFNAGIGIHSEYVHVNSFYGAI